MGRCWSGCSSRRCGWSFCQSYRSRVLFQEWTVGKLAYDFEEVDEEPVSCRRVEMIERVERKMTSHLENLREADFLQIHCGS